MKILVLIPMKIFDHFENENDDHYNISSIKKQVPNNTGAKYCRIMFKIFKGT